LLNPLGKKLQEFTLPEPVNGRSSVSLNLQDLPGGVYLVRISGDSFVHVQKLVIE
jgi:hypothetical protein